MPASAASPTKATVKPSSRTPGRRATANARAVVIVAVLLSAACSSPSAPVVPPPPPPETPSPAPAPRVVSVAVRATDAAPVTVGSRRQLIAVTTDSAGQTREVTEGVTWHSSNVVVATVSASGLLDAQAPGGVLIEATVTGGVSGALGVDVGAPTAPVARGRVQTQNRPNCAVAGGTPVPFDASASSGYRLP